MWSANDIYRPSAPHTRWTPLPVAPTSLRAFHHHSDSYCDNLHKLMQISNAEDKDDPLNLVPLDEGGIDPQSFSAHTLLASTTAPQSYLQAHEVGATQEELAKMEKYKAWEVVPRLSNMRVMVARWVYCETGKPSACKARSVPKGFSQIEGIDFNELFAFNHLQSRMRHQSCFSQQ